MFIRERSFGSETVALNTIGYRQVMAFLQGEISREELEPQVHVATRQYAKRQRTWFRSTPCQRTGVPEDPQLVAEVESLLVHALERIER